MASDPHPTPEILQFLQANRAELLEFLKSLVEQESPSSVPESQEPVLNSLQRSFDDLDFVVSRIPGQSSGGHLLATPRWADNSQPRQLMLGHCDTVWPLGTLYEMPVAIDGNRIRGPGVFDMKAGLAQIVFALRALKYHNLIPEVNPLVFVNSDEEIGSQESTPHIVELAPQMDRVLVLEPALGPSGKIKTTRKGVGRFTIIARGIPAHAGLEPEKGVSAILELSFLIQKLFALNDPARGVSVNVGMIEGGLRPNVIAPISKAIVDVRVPTREDARLIEETIYSLEPSSEGITLEIDGGIDRMPLEQTDRNLQLWDSVRSIGSLLDLDLEDTMAGGGSDGNTTSAYTATLDGLGAVGDGAHANHEFVYVDKLIERAALLALILLSPPLKGGQA